SAYGRPTISDQGAMVKTGLDVPVPVFWLTVVVRLELTEDDLRRVARRFMRVPTWRSPSPDGRVRAGGAGGRDIYLYDRKTEKLLMTPGLNSKAADFDPCVVALQE